MIYDKIVYTLLAVLFVAAGAASYRGYLGIDLAAFFMFVFVLATLIYKDRKNVRLESIVFIRRTRKGRDFIDRVARSHRTFWSRWALVGLIVAVPVMILGSYYLINQAAAVIEGSAQGGVRLLLPGPVSAPVNGPGVFVVPWWIWIIGIAAVIIPHEFMHGVVCRLDKIKIKSVGWILLIIIPGAFVEPDERQLKKAKRKTRMKVYAAGSFANLVVAGAIAVIFIAASVQFQPAGLYVDKNIAGPANSTNISSIILAINGTPVRSQAELSSVLSRYRPGDVIDVRATNDARSTLAGWDLLTPKVVAVTEMKNATDFRVQLGEHPQQAGKAYLGVVPLVQAFTFAGDLGLYQNIFFVLIWIFIFSFGIGLVNLLPLKPLDGGLLFEEIVGHFTPRTKKIVRAVTIVMIFLILFNLLGPIFL
jgi:membrane-associated protease RseP (regulator of RpoE activity)